MVEVTLVKNWDIVDLHVTKWSRFVSTKAIRWESVELASLMKKQERKKKEYNFYHHLVQDVDDHFVKHSGKESHIDSNGEG